MPKVLAVQVIYNNRPYIEPVFSAIFNQTVKNLEVIAVIAKSDDGSKELLEQKFPKVKIIDPGFNIGFAQGHNWVFENFEADFYQLVNPDLIMAPDYIERLLEVFSRQKVGAATGKLLKYEFAQDHKTKVIDSTGVIILKSGRAYDRGQHEEDLGQYDKKLIPDAVSGAGCLLKREALVKTRLESSSQFNGNFATKYEYFDQDFHSYWEDVDLTWRMRLLGFEMAFEPKAVAWHGRGAGSAKGGYKKVLRFISHHKKLLPKIRQLNYQNHIFMFLKNSPKITLQFLAREFFMLAYILLFEPGTLKIVPQMFRLLPKILQKRKHIQQMRLIS